MAFFGHFGQKMGFFGDGGSETLDNLHQQPGKTRFFEFSTLKIWWGALHSTTQAPQTLFQAKKLAFFGHFLGLAFDLASGPGGGVPVRKECGGELPGGGHEASSMRAQFTGAALTPAPTTQGHRGQGLVYTFGEEMTLKAAEAIKMVLDEGTACMANRTYHVHPETGDTWQYAFRGDDGMESIEPLPEGERQGAEISALARVEEE